MFPATERPGDHHVAKHMSWFAVNVLGRPGLEEGAGAQSNFHSRPRLFYRASLFNDAGIFPGRSEPCKRVGLGVPGVNNIGGGGHLAAINEQFAHR